MVQEKTAKALKNKMNIVVKDNDIEITRVVFGPMNLVKQLPNFIGHTPKDKTLVMVETQGDVVSAIKFVDISDELIGNAVKSVAKLRNKKDAVIFCLYVTDPDAYKGLASDLIEKFNTYKPSYVRDVLFINGNRWGSYMCYDDDCCPKGGREIE